MQQLSMQFPDLLERMWNQQRATAATMQHLGLFAQVCSDHPYFFWHKLLVSCELIIENKFLFYS